MLDVKEKIMNKFILSILTLAISFVALATDSTVIMNPNNIQYNSYMHKELPASLLPRIKATTDVFEIVDGISYEKAIDLYKRDLNPESNIVIWEEMAKAYKAFCKTRCKTQVERKDVYRALLLRSMFSTSESLIRLQPKSITQSEAKYIMSQYNLEPEPINVIQK